MSKCPRCWKELKPAKVNGVAVSLCKTSCGGLWCDAAELDGAKPVGQTPQQVTLNVSDSEEWFEVRELYCPKCGDRPMVESGFSAAMEGRIHTCYHCNGVWLDGREVAGIGKQYSEDSANVESSLKQADDVVTEMLAEDESATSVELVRSRRIARIFRLVIPNLVVAVT